MAASLVAASLQDAVLAAEELAWDKKMSALRQPATKGPSPGNAPVEQTEEDPEVVAAALRARPVQRVPITRATPGWAAGVVSGARGASARCVASTDCVLTPGRGIGVR